MTPAGVVGIEVREEVGGVDAQCVQQPEPIGTVAHHHAVTHQGDQEIERNVVASVRRIGDLAGGVEIEPTGEDPQPGEEGLLRLGQEPDAPLDRAKQGLLASGGISGTVGQELEPVVEPSPDGAGLEDVDACRGEFDGEREAVE